ncbi:2,5-diketo-D-gluconate reductase A [Arcanobacterium wilhelmae]|uniref:2,5-diketo-D-gluconate reductase A n=1 Tax=Arcanobacterium wilhelmae TaxID=1803177 RepID=A0ABT9NAY0_9ACTO|nr:aldo/keto reductase [Arcanobacterium wilhelmae]MDP9800863.1 2,5-diketo-D-gluconate reductase A [Arcanobacterium wilhelmae]WFN90232.1 aldo/keto reductase [Arcanobacterium wilhelmae]
MDITLNTGSPIPQLGFGTYKIDDGGAPEAVAGAIAAGYRHVDTAQMYGNEAGVGAGIAQSGVAREDIFLTTKLDNPNHRPDDVRRTLGESLERLGTDYVDLFLMHWPLPGEYDGDFISTYRVMEEFVASGEVRAIGVSNFQTHHLEKLMAATQIVPAVNQIEIHPRFQNRTVAAYCQAHGIAVESWSPLGRGRSLELPAIVEIAERLGARPAQVVLAWHLAKGFVAIPKSITPARQVENFGALELELSAGDVAAIDALDLGERGRVGMNPDTMERGEGAAE